MIFLLTSEIFLKAGFRKYRCMQVSHALTEMENEDPEVVRIAIIKLLHLLIVI